MATKLLSLFLHQLNQVCSASVWHQIFHVHYPLTEGTFGLLTILVTMLQPLMYATLAKTVCAFGDHEWIDHYLLTDRTLDLLSNLFRLVDVEPVRHWWWWWY